MSKTEFLKQAKEHYRKTNEKVVNGVDWVSEMNFIYTDELILRVWFDVKEMEYHHRWCNVTILPEIS